MYTITEACKVLGDMFQSDPWHVNTLLKYRRAYKNQLSETASPDYNGDTRLTENDIKVIAEAKQKSLSNIKSRKASPAPPKNAVNVLNKIDAQLSQNTEKIDVLEREFNKFLVDDYQDINILIEEQEQKIKNLEEKLILAIATINSLQNQITRLEGVGVAFQIAEMSSKLDKVLLSHSTQSQQVLTPKKLR